MTKKSTKNDQKVPIFSKLYRFIQNHKYKKSSISSIFSKYTYIFIKPQIFYTNFNQKVSKSNKKYQKLTKNHTIS